MNLSSKKPMQPALLLPALLACGALVLAWAQLAGGAVWARLVFMQGTDRYMDFFNCMVEAAHLQVYERSGSIYPPLANLVYYALGKLVVVGDSGILLRETMQGGVLYAAFTWTLLCALGLLAAHAVGGNWLRRLSAGVLCLASAPILYAVERGNLVVLAVALSFVFLLWYDSANPRLREMAIISLALAANIKIYPALLGLLLLCDKRWKTALRCAAYAAGLFLIPFLFMGGRSALVALFGSLSFTDGKFAVAGFGYKIDFGNTVAVLAGLFGHTAPLWQVAGARLGWGALVAGVCTLPFVRSRWRRAALLCACIAGVPGFSYQYNLCYLLPVAALFFAQECTENRTPQAAAARTHCARTLWYALLLAGCLVPLPFAPTSALAALPGIYEVSVTALVGGASLLLLTLTLLGHALADALCAIAQTSKGTATMRRRLCALVVALPTAAAVWLCADTALAARTFTQQYAASVVLPLQQLLLAGNVAADDIVLAVPHSAMAYRALGTVPNFAAPSVPATAQFNISYYLYAPLQAAVHSGKDVVVSDEVYRHWLLAAQAEQGDGFASMFVEVAHEAGLVLLRRAPETPLHTLLLAAQGERIFLAHLRADGSANLATFPDIREWQGAPEQDPSAFFAHAATTGCDIVASKLLLAGGPPAGYTAVQTCGTFVLLRANVSIAQNAL